MNRAPVAATIALAAITACKPQPPQALPVVATYVQQCALAIASNAQDRGEAYGPHFSGGEITTATVSRSGRLMTAQNPVEATVFFDTSYNDNILEPGENVYEVNVNLGNRHMPTRSGDSLTIERHPFCETNPDTWNYDGEAVVSTHLFSGPQNGSLDLQPSLHAVNAEAETREALELCVAELKRRGISVGAILPGYAPPKQRRG